MKRQRDVEIMDLPECIISNIFNHIIADGTVSLSKRAAEKVKNAVPLALCNSNLYCIFKRVVRESRMLSGAVRQFEAYSICEKCDYNRSTESNDFNSQHIVHGFIRKVELMYSGIGSSRYCLCQLHALLQLVLDCCSKVKYLSFQDHQTKHNPPTSYMKYFFTSGSLKYISTLSIDQPCVDTLQGLYLLHNLKCVLLSNVCPSLESAVGNIIAQSRTLPKDIYVTYHEETEEEDSLDGYNYRKKVVFQVQYMSSSNLDHSVRASIFRNVLKRWNDHTQVSEFHVMLHEPGENIYSVPFSTFSESFTHKQLSVGKFQNSNNQPFITAETSVHENSFNSITTLVTPLPSGCAVIVSSNQSRSVVELFKTADGSDRSRILTLDIQDILLCLGKRCVSLQDINGLPSVHDLSTINSIEFHDNCTWNRGNVQNFNQKSGLLNNVLCKASKNIEQVKISSFKGIYGESYRLADNIESYPSSQSSLLINFALRIVDNTPNLKVLEIDISFLYCLQHHFKEKTFFSRANSLEHLSITNIHDDRGYSFYFRPFRSCTTSREASGFVFVRAMPEILRCIRTFSKRFKCFNVDHGKWMELPSSFVDYRSGESGFSVSLDVQRHAQCYMKENWKEIALLLNTRTTHTPKLDSLIACMTIIGNTIDKQ